MRREETISFKNPVLSVIEYMETTMEKPTALSGVFSTDSIPEEDFVLVSLLSFDRQTQLTRTGDYLAWIYSRKTQGLSYSFDQGEKARIALENMLFHVEGVQVSTVENGPILTRSDFPEYYCQEIGFTTLQTAE